MKFGKIINNSFGKKNLIGSITGKINSGLKQFKNVVKNNLEKVAKQMAGKALGMNINQIEKALKKVGIYGHLDKLWKHYGIPAIKWSNQQIATLKEKYKDVPFANEIMLYIQADPRANKILGKLTDFDSVMQSLEKGDFRKTATLVSDLGISHQISRFLPPEEKIQLAREALHVGDKRFHQVEDATNTAIKKQETKKQETKTQETKKTQDVDTLTRKLVEEMKYTTPISYEQAHKLVVSRLGK